ncbi:MAG: nitrite reductase small subunit NirD [Streptosporangiales bacterium]|nr:nitrite reductase small subunit NirD [Streptosporangiales bacterium]
MTVMIERRQWTTGCALTQLQPERGVAVLLPDGSQAAVFRTHDGTVYALDNVDPACGAAVLSRGIVGDRGGVPTVTSPMLKHVYELASGRCLTDDSLAVDVVPVRVRGDEVQVAYAGERALPMAG